MVTRGGAPACTQPAHALCPRPHVIRAAAPRALAKALSHSGPALVWAPLAVWLWGGGGASADTARAQAAARAAGLFAALAFVATAMPVRYLRHVAPGGWDPSGHVFIFGVQLVPLWAAGDAFATWAPRARSGAAPLVARALSAVLVYSSATTAAFHHSATEVAFSWALVAALAAATGAVSTVAAAAPGAASARVWRHGAAAAAAAWAAGCAVPAWAALAAAGGHGHARPHAPSVAHFASHAAYDAAVMCVVLVLLAAGDGDGGSGEVVGSGGTGPNVAAVYGAAAPSPAVSPPSGTVRGDGGGGGGLTRRGGGGGGRKGSGGSGGEGAVIVAGS